MHRLLLTTLLVSLETLAQQGPAGLATSNPCLHAAQSSPGIAEVPRIAAGTPYQDAVRTLTSSGFRTIRSRQRTGVVTGTNPRAGICTSTSTTIDLYVASTPDMRMRNFTADAYAPAMAQAQALVGSRRVHATSRCHPLGVQTPLPLPAPADGSQPWEVVTQRPEEHTRLDQGTQIVLQFAPRLDGLAALSDVQARSRVEALPGWQLQVHAVEPSSTEPPLPSVWRDDQRCVVHYLAAAEAPPPPSGETCTPGPAPGPAPGPTPPPPPPSCPEPVTPPPEGTPKQHGDPSIPVLPAAGGALVTWLLLRNRLGALPEAETGGMVPITAAPPGGRTSIRVRLDLP